MWRRVAVIELLPNLSKPSFTEKLTFCPCVSARAGENIKNGIIIAAIISDLLKTCAINLLYLFFEPILKRYARLPVQKSFCFRNVGQCISRLKSGWNKFYGSSY